MIKERTTFQSSLLTFVDGAAVTLEKEKAWPDAFGKLGKFE
jgi:hypothetical protein